MYPTRQPLFAAALITAFLIAAPAQAQVSTPTNQTDAAQTTQPAVAPAFTTAAQAAAEAVRLSGQARATAPAGRASIDQPLWRQAAAAAEAAVKLEPGNTEYLALRADIYTATGFWARAQSGWQAYFSAAGEQATAQARASAGQVYYNLAYAAYTRQDLSAAAQLLDECLALAPDAAVCHLWAGRVSLEQGNFARAQNFYSRAAALDPTSSTASYFSRVAAQAGQYGPAATLAFSQAYADAEAGRREAALQGFTEAARLAPNFAEAHREAGRLALELGQVATARAAYFAVSALPAATAADRYNLSLATEAETVGLAPARLFREGYGRYTAGDKAAAESTFEAATSQNPQYAKAWAWLGRVQYEGGRYAEAAASYERAVTLDPSDSAAAHFLRMARARL